MWTVASLSQGLTLGVKDLKVRTTHLFLVSQFLTLGINRLRVTTYNNSARMSQGWFLGEKMTHMYYIGKM